MNPDRDELACFSSFIPDKNGLARVLLPWHSTDDMPAVGP